MSDSCEPQLHTGHAGMMCTWMPKLRPVQRRVKMLAVLVGVTAVSGAFVAGRQAGFAFNTFPLMEGRVIPEGYMELRPVYRNFFESVPSVQLHHRALAITTLASVSALWVQVQRMPLPPQLRLATDVLLLAVYGQLTLGVVTLINCVPVHLGSAHQAGALTLFSVVLFAMHSCRVPYAGRMAARSWERVASGHGMPAARAMLQSRTPRRV